MTATIDILRPLTRQQGVQIPNLIPASRWIDCVVLVAGVAQSYTLPSDSGQTPAVKGTVLRISSNSGPLYANFAATAAVATAKTDGSSSIILRTDLGPVLIQFPQGATALSLLCPGAAIVTIEAWA